jgi:chromosome segregation ATPase
MSRTRTKDRKAAATPGDAPLVHETRIDRAHHGGGDLESPAAVPNGPDGRESSQDRQECLSSSPLESAAVEDGEEQLHRQAAQLAEYLRARQRELDHRESQLNAQTAQLESDLRTARIWLSEREAEIQDRDRERAALQFEFRQRLDRLANAEAAFERRAAAVEQQGDLPREMPRDMKQAIGGISAAWASQSEALAAQADRHTALRQNASAPETVNISDRLSSREKRLARWAEELAGKQRELEDAERRMVEAQAEVDRIREQLLAERKTHREEVRNQWQQMATDERRAVADLEKKRELLERRADHVDQCRAALEQLRTELKRLHRETLEIRLATEELWAQLSDAAPPAALTRSLGRIRTQLADEYRLANAELVEQKKELASIRDQLVEQYEKLRHERRQFDCVAAARRQEADEQAARLIAREQELEDAESRFAAQSQRWESERREYEQEIRRLRLQVVPQEAATKVA